MDRKFTITLVLAVLISVTLGFVIAKAGPIDPPPGPVEPTNVTLQQIFDRFDSVIALKTQQADPINDWDYAGRTNTVQDPVPEILLPAGTSGILHAVVIGGVSTQGNLALFEGDGVTPIGEYATPGQTTGKVILNIRFSNGIAARRDNNVTGYTILYKTN